MYEGVSSNQYGFQIVLFLYKYGNKDNYFMSFFYISDFYSYGLEFSDTKLKLNGFYWESSTSDAIKFSDKFPFGTERFAHAYVSCVILFC